MPRVRGARNANYELRRRELLQTIRSKLAEAGRSRPSWRDLLAAAEISASSMRHYFGNREFVVEAMMRDDFRLAGEHIRELEFTDLPYAQSVLDLIENVSVGLQNGVSRIISTGLVESLLHPRLGPVFLECVMDPSISAIERRLRLHDDRGEVQLGNARIAAVHLFSPLMTIWLHQSELAGSETSPLHIPSFCEAHADAFLRAYPPHHGHTAELKGQVRASSHAVETPIRPAPRR